MKREESDCAVSCYPKCGPVFGNKYGDIAIISNCNEEDSCWIGNDGEGGYECHPIYKSSLFVGTGGHDQDNIFAILDYEVFRIENYNDYIYHICKYPDIIWKYIETKDISEESMKQFDNDTELLNDLDAIHCEDSNIMVKISRFYLKNPSEFLPDTQLVDQKYDSYLRKWLGSDYKWKLLYRASEHDYTAKSFHEYCNDKRPTLIVIKSDRGWIFGGYTTQSWSGEGIYYDCDLIIIIEVRKCDSKAFIFTLKNPHGVKPTRYMKRKESRYAIYCDSAFGPIFGSSKFDIGIDNQCNRKDKCYIKNDNEEGYECHPKYKCSLFVNTAGPNHSNYFSVLDYEVYTHY